MKQPTRPIQVSLTEYDHQLLDEAVRIVSGGPADSRERKRLLRFAIHAFCREVIAQGEMPRLPAVTLREETQEETEQRAAQQMPGAERVQPRFKWLSE